MVQLNNLPADLRTRGRFCCWKLERRGDKNTKVPYNPRTGGHAQANNPETFSTLEEAERALRGGESYSGLGVGIFGNLAAIDIDHCISGSGELAAHASDIVKRMDCYTEVSPSGRGLRLLFSVPEGFRYDKSRYYINRQELGLEVYVAGATQKYVTVTGQAMNGHKQLVQREKQLAEVLETYMVRPEKRPVPSGGRPDTQTDAPEDMELLQLARSARNGEDFAHLWAGDWTGYKSQSEADLALCNLLAFWTGRDCGRVDRLFRRSGLMREKWDRQQSGSSYGAITVRNACESCREVYTPGYSAAVSAPAGGGTAEAWKPPEPFEAEKPLPEFPVEALPLPVARYVEALAENLQVPPEMPALLSLGVLAAALQDRFRLEITPSWSETLSLFVVAVMLPGERKSPVFRALTAPLYRYQTERQEWEEPELTARLREVRILTSKLAALETAATRPNKSGEFKAYDRNTAEELEAELRELKRERLVPYRLLCDDTTPEKLADLMDGQGGAITVASTEGGVFDALKGRYDNQTALELYLKGYSGDSVTIDRISRRGSFIPNARLSVILTVQPEVLGDIMGNNVYHGRGLLDRFLYVVPRSLLGRRKVDAAAVPAADRDGYGELLAALLRKEGGDIRLSGGAYRVLCDFQRDIEPRLIDQWESFQGWASKLAGQTARIAALLHIATAQGDPTELPVSEETMAAAIQIAWCLAAHAERAFSAMGADGRRAEAKYTWRRLSGEGKTELSKSEALRLARRFRTADEMEPSLRLLEEMGYLRLREQRTGGRGRPSQTVELNPLALEKEKRHNAAGNP